MNSRTIAVIIVILLLIVAGVVIWDRARDRAEVAGNGNNAPVLTVDAYNQTQNTPVSQTTARPGDTVEFTLTAQNQSADVMPGYVMEANISGLSESATLIDAHGASYNAANQSLVWTPLDILPYSSIEQKITVRVNPLAEGANASLDIEFGNPLTVQVAASQSNGVIAGAQNGNYQAPTTGPAHNLALFLALAATAIVWAKNRFARKAA